MTDEILVPMSAFVERNGKTVRQPKKTFRVSNVTEIVRLPGERQWRVWQLVDAIGDDDVRWAQTSILTLDEAYDVIKKCKENNAKRKPPRRAAA